MVHDEHEAGRYRQSSRAKSTCTVTPFTDRDRPVSPSASLILAGTCEDPVVSKPAMRKWILIFVCLTQVCRLQAQREQDPIQAILQLFEQHPIVMFGEVHGCVQEHALTEETRDLAGVRRSRERRGD